VQEEVTAICNALIAGEAEQRLRIKRIVALVDFDGPLPGRVRREALSSINLNRALRGELGGPFHLFHYCGHYIPNRETAGGFLLNDGQDMELFNLVEWRNALMNTSLRLVCLNACGSGAHVSDPNLYQVGAAHAALTMGVPAVIGMRWSIRDGQALDFSRLFYPSLMKTGIPEIALFKTRCELSENETTTALWAAPVMLTR
jgi:hypothetical protein